LKNADSWQNHAGKSGKRQKSISYTAVKHWKFSILRISKYDFFNLGNKAIAPILVDENPRKIIPENPLSLTERFSFLKERETKNFSKQKN